MAVCGGCGRSQRGVVATSGRGRQLSGNMFSVGAGGRWRGDGGRGMRGIGERRERLTDTGVLKLPEGSIRHQRDPVDGAVQVPSEVDEAKGPASL